MTTKISVSDRQNSLIVSACLDGFVRFRFRSIFDMQSCLFVDV